MLHPSDIGTLPPIVSEDLDTGESESYAVTFAGANATVQLVITTELDEEKISQYRNSALDIARSALDIVCFQTGWGLLLYLDRYISPDGVTEILVPGDPRLASLVSLRDVNFPIIFQLLAGDTALHRAMNDLITGITWPHAPAINCARAVEGIRTHMSPQEIDRGRAWGIFQENLNITSAYRDFVTNLSIEPRHGNTTHIAPSEQEEAIARAWNIMDRYFQYLRRGCKPLDPALFPLL